MENERFYTLEELKNRSVTALKLIQSDSISDEEKLNHLNQMYLKAELLKRENHILANGFKALAASAKEKNNTPDEAVKPYETMIDGYRSTLRFAHYGEGGRIFNQRLSDAD